MLAVLNTAPVATAEIIAAGGGSNSMDLPSTCKPLPEKICKTAGVKGLTITGHWWSSLHRLSPLQHLAHRRRGVLVRCLGHKFPKDFPQVALGMVWGGKGAFANWFSADIDCIHGTN